jgi:hypothetical protein
MRHHCPLGLWTGVPAIVWLASGCDFENHEEAPFVRTPTHNKICLQNNLHLSAIVFMDWIRACYLLMHVVDWINCNCRYITHVPRMASLLQLLYSPKHSSHSSCSISGGTLSTYTMDIHRPVATRVSSERHGCCGSQRTEKVCIMSD